MIKQIKYGIASATVAVLSLPVTVLAQDNPFERGQTMVEGVQTASGVGQQASLETMIGNIINIALGFIGVLLLVYILWAGFVWMTAGGDTKKVEEAQTRIRNAIIGLLVIIVAFALSNFILGSLINVTQ